MQLRKAHYKSADLTPLTPLPMGMEPSWKLLNHKCEFGSCPLLPQWHPIHTLFLVLESGFQASFEPYRVGMA